MSIINCKTYTEDFLKKFPKATLRNSSVPTVCRGNVYGVPQFCHGTIINCTTCWNTKMDTETEMEDDVAREYAAAVEYAEHCRIYEPTYNPEDGSM